MVRIGSLVILLAFLLPGFDIRWSWSQIPTWLSILAEAGVLLGYAMVVRVFFENRYASRVVEVTGGQQVIHTGLYGVIRHPMYAGTIVLYILSPLALGSYWAVIPAAFIIPVLAVRILDEEDLLRRELPGYAEYTHQVRYRLLPGVW